MPGVDLAAFADFMFTTGPTIASGRNRVINDARARSYLLDWIISGSMKKLLQGGSSIKDIIFLDAKSTYRRRKVGQGLTYQQPQVLDEWSIPWRFADDHAGWSKEILELNTGRLAGEYVHHEYKRLKAQIMNRLYQSIVDGMEADIFAVPDPAEMELSTGTRPNSLFLYSNEFANGLYPSYLTANGGPNTVQGIDPTVKTGWSCVREDYKSIGAVAGATAPHLFTALDKAWVRSGIKRLPKYPEAGEAPNRINKIITNLVGLTNFTEAQRINNDHFRNSKNSPHYDAEYRGVEIMEVAALDTAAVYPTGSGGALSTYDDATNSNDGPRYHGFSQEYLTMCFHEEGFFRKIKPFPLNESGQFNQWVMPVDLWRNMYASSRRRHFCIYPSASI